MENKKLTKEIAALKTAYLTGKKVPDLDIALASYSVLDEYCKLSYPTQPKKIVDYYKLASDVRTKMNRKPEDYKDFWTDADVVKFFDDKHRVININRRNLDWLYWMKETLENDTEKVQAIEMKIYQFKDDYPIIEQPTWSD